MAFLDSAIEREAIVSTLLGDGLPCHTRWGCWLAKKTVVYSGARAAGGLPGGDETAHVIFTSPSAK